MQHCNVESVDLTPELADTTCQAISEADARGL